MRSDERNHDDEAGEADFHTTRWSVVLAAGQQSSPNAHRALATLCQTYWYPLYAYIRRRVPHVHEARDLTQEFFCRLLEKNSLAVAQPQRGRFRAFLLTTLKHFLANQWDKAKAQRRGGGRRILSLDFESGESRWSLEPGHDLTPERLYDRQWTLVLLEQVLSRLRAEFVAAGKEEHFEQLKPFIAGSEASMTYADLAAELGMTESAARVAAHRLRRRYRELLRAEIAHTVSDPGEVDDEIHRLFENLSK